MPTSQSEYKMFSQFKYTEVSLQHGNGKGFGEVIIEESVSGLSSVKFIWKAMITCRHYLKS